MLSSIFRARKCNIQPGPLVDNYGIIILGMLLFRLSHSWTSIHNTIIFIIIPGEGILSPYLHCNLLYLKIWPRIRLYPYCVTLPISCIISFSVWLSFKDTEVALNLRLDFGFNFNLMMLSLQLSSRRSAAVELASQLMAEVRKTPGIYHREIMSSCLLNIIIIVCTIMNKLQQKPQYPQQKQSQQNQQYSSSIVIVVV